MREDMAATKTQAIEIPDFITVRDLAALMDVSPINVIKELMSNGIMVNINQEIDFETAAIVAEEMGFEPTQFEEEEEEIDESGRPVWRQILASEKSKDLQPRPPVVTMLGHVDHGKTSLLDVIRQANVVSGEAGGITQHIGAYQAVTQEGKLITFLDTPGHEAFTAMRARGAQATDIAILVVAADDGLMPQTREAIDHARAAGVPIVVALNKIDLPTARPDHVKQQLNEVGLTPDDWDGDTLVIPVSATQRIGIDDLLEAIALTAEELNPRANPKARPTGTVIEARTERGLGIMVTLLVQNGTLNQGDTLLIGPHYGRIKAMYDYHGQRIKSAGPSTPVSVAGLSGIPEAGDQFEVVKSEKVARKIVADREEEMSDQPEFNRRARLEDFFSRLQSGESKTLNLIVKADVQGSLEPLISSLEKLDNDEVDLDILSAATGNVSENDINLATASDAVILGFNVEMDSAAEIAAVTAGIDVKLYSVIYHLLEDVERAMKGLMEPVLQERIIGRAEVRQAFQIRKVGTIAGSYMRTGEGRRNAHGRLIRNNQLIYDGPVSSLKHLQENVRSVKAGFEFGVNLGDWNDYREGDIIEFYVTERVQPT
ncbi:MAG: translation initiation factor IF-2 [Anaerolineales bacterium]|nr:translation initiation factor IF-2 [Anaerolineales bacterium]